MKFQRFLNKVANIKKAVLSSEIASIESDPNFTQALQILPNPDPILRKLGASQDVYNAIGYDSHVAGEVRSQRGNLLKKKWRVQPSADDAKSIEAYELCKNIFSRRPSRNMQWSDQIYNTFRGIYTGFSVSEVVWQRQGNHIVPCDIKDKPNRRFVFGTDHELRLLVKSEKTKGIELPDYKFLLARHMPSTENPQGFALFSACFWAYTFKRGGYRAYTRFVDRYGLPSPVAKYPIGTTESQQDELADALAQLVEDNVAVIPEGNSVELLETKVGSDRVHGSYLNFCNREISKCLTSQTLASEVTEAGSRSTAGVQKERQDDNGSADEMMVSDNYQELCDWITDLNFDDATPPIWEFYQEAETSKDVAETLEVASRTAPVKRDEYYSRMQLTPPETGDDIIFNPDSRPQPNPGENQESNSFRVHTCGHQFNQSSDPLSNLADQGVAKSKKSIENMTNTIEELVEKSENFEQVDEALADLLDSVDIDGFVESVQDAKVIANAAGQDDA